MVLNKTSNEHIGAFLAEHRKAAGLSQQDIARKMKLKSNQHVSNVERGVSPASMDFLKKYLRITGAPKKDFVVFIQQTYVDQIREALK